LNSAEALFPEWDRNVGMAFFSNQETYKNHKKGSALNWTGSVNIDALQVKVFANSSWCIYTIQTLSLLL
jgi:hypothetical protein